MDDLKTLARDLRRTARVIVSTTNDVSLRVANATKAKAVRQSSGRRTAKERKEADYPYAKRHGKALWDASTINVGKGDFRSSWVVDSVPGPNGIYRRGVANRSDHAEFLEEGTKNAFARPLKEILEKARDDAWERIAPPAYEAALQTVFAR